jgi:hypothetical protein
MADREPDTWTREQHRARALDLGHLADNSDLRRAEPLRLALLAEAQIHATLALSAPSPVTVSRSDLEYTPDMRDVIREDIRRAALAAASDAAPEPSLPDPGQPDITTRKRPAKKATPSKETSK